VIKGVQIDCRCQMMRTDSIREVMRSLARLGFNTVLFEYWDRFPYEGRLSKTAAPDALTRDEIAEMNSLASDLGLNIIPLVQCLGHLKNVLRFPEFGQYGENANGRQGGTLCPSRPESQELFTEMAGQVLEMHPNARYFHMGGDEASLDPECPHCGPRRETEGVGRVLGDYYVGCADWIRAQGPDPIIWSDMPLTHPETLDLLRGHVIMMDWDYWSLQEPVLDMGMAWGARRLTPDNWPEAHQEIVHPYYFMADGISTPPFPYTRLLRDRGFQVITAPAARSGGDSFCVPSARKIENVLAGVKTAAETHVLGCVITSWALRLVPWPLTEHSLIAGAMAMENPDVSRQEIDARFAAEHFGVTDPELARIPLLMGVGMAGYMTEARPRFHDDTGHWFATDYDGRAESIKAEPENALKSFDTMLANLDETLSLLQRARPTTAAQRQQVDLWRWAHDVLRYYAEFGPQVLKEPGTHDLHELTAFRKRAESLADRTDRLLRPMLTDWTMIGEQQVRFGIHLEYLDELIAQADRRAR
jgi:hypothetical protein